MVKSNTVSYIKESQSFSKKVSYEDSELSCHLFSAEANDDGTLEIFTDSYDHAQDRV